MQKLDWLPLYIDKLLSSKKWQQMKDYQKGWYIELLLYCTRSEPLGYVRLDGHVWRIAGAHSQPMWEQHKGAVMACFKIRHIDGQDYLYNEKLLSVMEDQSQKYLRGRPSLSPSLFLRSSVNSKEEVSLEVKAKFTKPSLEEVRRYCAERGNSVDPEKWLSHYESNGWKVGKNPMKNWRAAVRTWEKNGIDPSVTKGPCTKHPESGLTTVGTCWGCYSEKYGEADV